MIAPLEVETREDMVIVRAAGEIDIATAGQLRDGCFAAVTNDSLGLVLDLSRVSFLDSSGVRALFVIAERLDEHRQHLALVVPDTSHVRRVLGIVNIEGSASVHDTIEDAGARLRDGIGRGAAR